MFYFFIFYGAYLARGDTDATARCYARREVLEAVEDPRAPLTARGFGVLPLRYQAVFQ